MAKTMNLPWEEAIRQVLQKAGGLHYTEVAEQIVSLGLRRNVGATPAATVASYLSTSLKDKSASPYIRTGKGQYALKEGLQDRTAPSAEKDDEDASVETGALRSFGMFWQRDLVSWTNVRPRLLGRQSVGATNVDFAEQIGIYLLHDRERVIYVGRASEGLSYRLRAHTIDRLGGRWDRFSWFGIRSVDENAKLTVGSTTWNESVVIDTMEALLIESLEPPLNRKRGDNFSGAEFLQLADPKIDEARKKAWLAELAAKTG